MLAAGHFEKGLRNNKTFGSGEYELVGFGINKKIKQMGFKNQNKYRSCDCEHLKRSKSPNVCQTCLVPSRVQAENKKKPGHFSKAH